MRFISSVAGTGTDEQLGKPNALQLSAPATVADSTEFEAWLPMLGAHDGDVWVLRSEQENLTRWIVGRKVPRTRAARIVESLGAALAVPVGYGRAVGVNGPGFPVLTVSVTHPVTGHRFVVSAHIGEVSTFTTWRKVTALRLRGWAENAPLVWRLTFSEAGQ